METCVAAHNFKNSFPRFEWDVINSCDETLLIDCANLMCQFIGKFNGLAYSFHNILEAQKQTKEKLSKLSDHCQKLENCKKCAQLQICLDDQVSKMQTLAAVFGQISNENAEKSRIKLEKVQDIFTQIVEESNVAALEQKQDKYRNFIYGKRRRLVLDSLENSKESADKTPTKCESARQVTPQKRIRSGKSCEISPNKIEMRKRDCEGSPIIGKRQKGQLSKSQENKLSSIGNLSSRLDAVDTYVISSSESTSPASHREDALDTAISKKHDEDKTLTPKIEPQLDLTLTKAVSPSKDKKKSASLMQKCKKEMRKNPNESINLLGNNRRSPRSKKLKQVRLSFSNVKIKKPCDLSLQESFCGGLRTFSCDDAKMENDEENMIKIAVQLSLNESLKSKANEDDDVIDASPSNQPNLLQRKGHKIRKQKIALSKDDNLDNQNAEKNLLLNHEPQDKQMNTSPNKKKICLSNKSVKKVNDFTFPLLAEKENGSKKGAKEEPDTSPVKSLNKISPSKDASHIYKEEVVRKKSEKMKLPGWSCNKCKDFYEVAFKGNVEMIREKMNECSKHRGKFNPQRTDTPAGFWDLNMPSTQDTESFNKRNNRD